MADRKTLTRKLFVMHLKSADVVPAYEKVLRRTAVGASG